MFAHSMSGNSPNGRLMFQPDAKNVASRVYVPVMGRPAVAAFPAPHSKRAHTFRAAGGDGPAARARLGTVSFVGFNEHGSVPSGLVAEHVPETRPACIENGLCHPCLCKTGRAYVTDHDSRVFPRNPGGFHVEVMLPRIGDLGMYRAHPLLVVRPLGNAQLAFVSSIVTQGRDLAAVRQSGEVFEAKVNADCGVTGGQVISNFALKCEKPSTTRVLDEVTKTKLAADVARFPKAEPALQINELIALDLHAAWDKRHPSKGSTRAEADTKTRASTMLVARFGELAANLPNRVRMKAKHSRTASCQFDKIKGSRPTKPAATLPPSFGFALNCNTVIPDLVTCHSVAVEMPISAFHSIFEGQHRHFHKIVSPNGIGKENIE